MIHNLLSSNEIADILNNPIVKTNKDKLSTHPKVDFSIELPDVIKTKLETGFGINLAQIASIPMRWIKGDTPQHIDAGENNFNNTYLLYLTDSIGILIIDGQSYPITAGDAHIFSEGLAHSTINTGDSERLMIGPMSETGFRVGEAPTPPPRRFSMRSLFTDNAQVYYKPHSLSTGGDGSGVTNSRIKQRRT